MIGHSIKNCLEVEYIETKKKKKKQTKAILSWSLHSEEKENRVNTVSGLVDAIKKRYTPQKYEVKELYKLYTGFKLSNLDYVRCSKITIQSEKEGFYVEPEIKIENNKATITKNNEVIGRVNDARSITLLKAINKHKDIVTVKGGILNNYTFKQVSKHEGKLKVTVTTNEKINIKNIIKRITQGCRFNEDEVWLFLSDDPTSMTENSMILILPDNAYCRCVLDGNELKMKQIIKHIQ